jgi:predicted regulator of Ras-like GTPase activity (Roadblock/LC7/MglB family)
MPEELIMDSKALIFATLADVYLSSGMVDEAISILKDGLSRNPGYTLAKIILGRAYYLKGDTEQAIKTLEAIYDVAKESESENLYLGHCYKKLGEYEKAIKYYETVTKINPENNDARQALMTLKPEAPAKEAKKEAEHPAVKKEELRPKEKEVVSPVVVGIPKEELVKKEDLIPPEIMEKMSKVGREEEMVSAEPSLIEPAPSPVPKPEVTAQENLVIEEHVRPKVVEEPKVIKKAEPEIPPRPIPTKEPEREITLEELSAVELKVEPPAAKVQVPQPPVQETVVEKPAGKKAEPEKPPVIEKEAEPVEMLPEIGLEPVTAARPSEPAVVPAPLEALDKPMATLLENKSVMGAFICARDGLMIQSYYRGREDLEEICATIAAIYNDADDAFKFLKAGALEKCIIEKKDETVCVITAGESLLCIITKPEAKPGLVFVYARKIIDQIREILG